MRSLRSAALPLAVLLVSVAAAGCGGTRTAADGAPIVAEWTADELSLAEYEAEYARAEAGLDLAALTPDSLAERRVDFLQRYVDFRLKVLEARRAGYDQDSSYLAEVADYRDDLAGPYFTDAEILDGIVRDLYEKGAEQVEVSHILLLADENTVPADTLAKLNRLRSLRDSIVAGQIEFGEAAARYSEDPSAQRPDGQIGARGQLNYLSAGQVVLPFEDAMYRTPVGEVSQPVRSQFGYHLVYVTGRRATPQPISARHILIRWPGSTPADSARARTTIDSLRAEIEAGADFAALASEFSEDPGSAANGGDLGEFGPGRMVPSFEAAAFALEDVGDVSGPVETRFGVHLIQLTASGERPSFDEQYDELKRTAQRLPRTSLRRQAVGREEREARGATFAPEAVRGALAGVPADSALAFAAQGFGAAEATPFATLDGETFTLGDLSEALRTARLPAADAPEDAIVTFADDYVTEQAVEAAIGSLEDRDPEFARIFRGYAEGVLLFRIAEDSVWTRAGADSVGLRQTFEAGRETYRWPERRRILAFRTPGDSLLRAVSADLRAGMEPGAVFEKHRSERFALRLDTLRLADRTDTPLDATFDLAVGESTDVLPERSRLAVYVLDGIEAPRLKTFREARAETISDYQAILESEWSARLRERYSARVYPERLPPFAPEASGEGAAEVQDAQAPQTSTQ